MNKSQTNKLNAITLTQSDVVDILDQTRHQTPVHLVAVDYNWGPPVSGRFDTDFIQIWAVVQKDVQPRSVRLLKLNRQVGQSPPDWSNQLEFERVEDCKTYQLYLFNDPRGLSTEFVIELETTDGQRYYDNNGGYGVNYRLAAYSGRGTTAVASSEAIYNLKGIASVSLFWKNYRLHHPEL
jgi:hypothetical protein